MVILVIQKKIGSKLPRLSLTEKRIIFEHIGVIIFWNFKFDLLVNFIKAVHLLLSFDFPIKLLLAVDPT